LYIDENYSLRDIAIKLNSEGIPPPSGRSQKWYTVTIGDILKNEAYIGKKFQNKYESELKHSLQGKQYFTISKKEKPSTEWVQVFYPPLISEERYNQIQARINFQRRKPKKHYAGHENKFIAENVLFCGYCGGKIRKRFNQIENFHYCCYWWEAGIKERESHQHKKCSLGYVNAERIDEVIFNEIVNVLSEPSKFAVAWYKDERLDELKDRVKTLTHRKKEIEAKLERGFRKIKEAEDPDIRKLYEKENKNDETDYKMVKNDLKKAEDQLGFTTNRINRLAEFEKAIKNSGKRQMMSTYSSTQKQFKDFLHNLPAEEKKRIIESVISPETGGKCIIRYVTPFDYVDDIRNIPKEELFEPQKDREPIIDLNFNIDLNRIEKLIAGLDNRVLLNSVSPR
jgi:hypothetical protein